jgi:hypothetical protein
MYRSKELRRFQYYVQPDWTGEQSSGYRTPLVADAHPQAASTLRPPSPARGPVRLLLARGRRS